MTPRLWNLKADLSLPLLVFLVGADHADDAAAADDLALIANALD